MKTMTVTDAELRARRVKKREAIELQAGVGSGTVYRFTNHLTAFDAVGVMDALGHEFVPIPFVVGMIGANNQGTEATDITFEDIGAVIKAIGYTSTMNNWPVNIYEVWFDAAGAVLYTEPLLIDGRVDGLNADVQGLNDQATVGVLGSPLDEQVTSPQQEYSGSCRHRYKDEMCAYSGGLPACLRTLEDCAAHENLPRFGGFPYGPVAGGKFMYGPFAESLAGPHVWDTESS